MDNKIDHKPALPQSAPPATDSDILAEYNRQNGIAEPLLQEGAVLCENYVVESRLEVASGEADLYLCGYGKGKYLAKVYKRQFPLRQEAVDQLLQLDSPYVAKLVAVGTHNGYPVEIFPYYKNGSLQGKRYREEELIDGIIPALNEGLHAIHSAGLLHKKLKPTNIMLHDDGKTVVISDLGICSAAEESGTDVSVQPRTAPEYSAPESFRNQYHEGSDYYSLGITLFELFCGYTPYANMQPDEIEQYAAQQRIPFPAGMTDRLKDLISALTYYAEKQEASDCRWTYEAVKKWLAGDDTLLIPGARSNDSGEKPMPAYSFLEESYTDPNVLVTTLAKNWEEGKKHLFRGYLTAHFKSFDLELAQKCKSAEEAAARENGKDDRIYWELLYQLNPALEGFYWKGVHYESLPALGRELLEQLWKEEHTLFPFYASLLSEGVLTQYVCQIAPNNETLKEAVTAIEDSYVAEKATGTDLRKTYFQMAYTLSGQKLFLLDGQKFRTVGELVGYMKEVLAVSRKNFEGLCHRLVDYEGRLDLQLEAWLIAIGKQKEIEQWRISMHEL